MPSDKGGYDAGLDVDPTTGNFVAQFIFIDPADREKAVNGGGPRIMAWMVRVLQCIILHPLLPCLDYHMRQPGTVCRHQQVTACVMACVMLEWHSHRIAYGLEFVFAMTAHCT